MRLRYTILLLAIAIGVAGCKQTLVRPDSGTDMDVAIRPYVERGHEQAQYAKADALIAVGKQREADKLLVNLAHEGYPPALKRLLPIEYTELRGVILTPALENKYAMYQRDGSVKPHWALEKLAQEGDHDGTILYWNYIYADKKTSTRPPLALAAMKYLADNGHADALVTLTDYYLGKDLGRAQTVKGTKIRSGPYDDPKCCLTDEQASYSEAYVSKYFDYVKSNAGRADILFPDRFVGYPLALAIRYQRLEQYEKAKYWMNQTITHYDQFLELCRRSGGRGLFVDAKAYAEFQLAVYDKLGY